MPEVLDPPLHPGPAPEPEPQSPGVSNRVIWAVLTGCLVAWTVALVQILF